MIVDEIRRKYDGLTQYIYGHGSRSDPLLSPDSTVVAASVLSLGYKDRVPYRLSILEPDKVHRRGTARHTGQPGDVVFRNGTRLYISRQL